MVNIRASASARDDARYRNLAQAYLSFEPSQEVVGSAPLNPEQTGSASLGANTPAYDPNVTGYIGPAHIGSFPTPPAGQGRAPTPSTAQNVASRGFFASQPVLPTIEIQRTPQPFPWSQGATPSYRGLSGPSTPSGDSKTTPASAGGHGNRASTEVTHISETTRDGSTVIPETPRGEVTPQSSGQQFVPSSFSSPMSLGSSSVLGNPNSPRPVDPGMGRGPTLLNRPPELNEDISYELPPPSGQRPPASSSDGKVSETPESSSYIPRGSLSDYQSSPLRPPRTIGSEPGNSSPMQLDNDDEGLQSIEIEVLGQFTSSPPQRPGLVNPVSSSPGYDKGAPSSSQPINSAGVTIVSNTSSEAGGASQVGNNTRLPPPSSSSLFIPETSPFNTSQFPPSSQTLYNPNFEIHGPAPGSQVPGILVPPALSELQTRMNNGGRSFQPTQQSRALRPDERGYWVVDTSAWMPQQWLAVWAYLAEFVGGGASGWSVSVRRDADGSLLRVYCFGTMVEHVWWLLFQASEGSIAAMGAQWLDTGGIVVLNMEAGP